MYNYFFFFRYFVDHKQTEEYNSFTRRIAKTVAAVCLKHIGLFKIKTITNNNNNVYNNYCLI